MFKKTAMNRCSNYSCQELFEDVKPLYLHRCPKCTDNFIYE